MTWDKEGNFFVTELGPSKNDEINLVKAGQNYGWPEQECSGKVGFVNSVMCYDPSIEPGGIVFYIGNRLDIENKIVMASLRGSNLYTLEVTKDSLASQKSILSGIGRIRDVNEGDDGYLYVITSNTDGKGFPTTDDDKLVRILK
jgi:glucose/arabinose dehydrogenase